MHIPEYWIKPLGADALMAPTSNRGLLPLDSPKPMRKSRAPGPKVRAAIDLMVWQGHHRDEAAKLAGIKPKSLYNAFRKHHVRAYYVAELGVLRESARAKTFHRLEALRDQDENRAAAVKACQVLEQLGEQTVNSPAVTQAPGFVIIISRPDEKSGARQMPAIIESTRN